MSCGYVLVAAGLLGAGIDILLHWMQMVGCDWATRKTAAWLTLLSCVLVGLSLTTHFNLGAAAIEVFVGCLCIYALVTGKEVP